MTRSGACASIGELGRRTPGPFWCATRLPSFGSRLTVPFWAKRPGNKHASTHYQVSHPLNGVTRIKAQPPLLPPDTILVAFCCILGSLCPSLLSGPGGRRSLSMLPRCAITRVGAECHAGLSFVPRFTNGCQISQHASTQWKRNSDRNYRHHLHGSRLGSLQAAGILPRIISRRKRESTVTSSLMSS